MLHQISCKLTHPVKNFFHPNPPSCLPSTVTSLSPSSNLTTDLHLHKVPSLAKSSKPHMGTYHNSSVKYYDHTI
jgi:hypothetical protein